MVERRCSLLLAGLLLMVPTGTDAQNPGPGDIAWKECPCTEPLGAEATISVPAGFLFADQAGTRRFLELTENPTDGSERGMVLRKDGEDDFWFAVFEYADSGYIKDDEQTELDADAILTSLREGNARGNEERRKRGWSEVLLRGWHHQPHYDSVTHNLTWSTRVGSPEQPGDWVNHSVRLLGRSGSMNVDLVADMDQVASALPEFEQVVRGFTFTPGNRYAEFRAGDRVAEYGLTALIAGGVGAAAAKSGLLGKLGKFSIYLFLGFLALLKGLWSRLTRRRHEEAALAAAESGSSDGPRDGWH